MIMCKNQFRPSPISSKVTVTIYVGWICSWIMHVTLLISAMNFLVLNIWLKSTSNRSSCINKMHSRFTITDTTSSAFWTIQWFDMLIYALLFLNNHLTREICLDYDIINVFSPLYRWNTFEKRQKTPNKINLIFRTYIHLLTHLQQTTFENIVFQE